MIYLKICVFKSKFLKLDFGLINLEKPTTTLGSNTDFFEKSYSQRKNPHFVWIFPLHSVFTLVGGFSLKKIIFIASNHLEAYFWVFIFERLSRFW
jgi:hypothetical protein